VREIETQNIHSVAISDLGTEFYHLFPFANLVTLDTNVIESSCLGISLDLEFLFVRISALPLEMRVRFEHLMLILTTSSRVILEAHKSKNLRCLFNIRVKC